MTRTRLNSLHLENFRSITGSWTIPLDAQVVLVHGPNGTGKTSLLSAIELASTGSVGFLDQQATELHDALLNRNYSSGKVQLGLQSSDGSTITGAFALDKGGFKGKAALSQSEKLLFLERCYLPQTALGRLLETYTATGKQVDTALVRFVKTVVGLDDLDNLIDGLRPAGHLSRAKAASQSWGATEDELTAAQKTREGLFAQLEHAELLLAEAMDSLRTLYDNDVHELPDEELLRYVARMGNDNVTELDESDEYESIRVRLEGISAGYTSGIGTGTTHLDPAGQAEAANRAAAAYVEWETGNGAHALAQLNRIRAEAFSLPNISATQIFDAFEDCQTRLREENRRRAAARERKLEAAHIRSRLTREIDALVAKIQVREASIVTLDVPSDVRVLVEIIEKTISLVDSEVCPVCDQHFEQADATLHEHLQEKLASLSRGAQDLMQARAGLQSLHAKVERLTNELKLAEPPPEEDAPLDSFERELNSLEAIITVGAERLKEMEQTEARKAVATAHQATRDVANRRLAQLRDELGVREVNLEISEEIQRLAGIIEQRAQEASHARTRQIREIEAIATIKKWTQEAENLRSQLTAVDNDVWTLRKTIDEAKARKAAANSIRLEAERVRSSVINLVFDQTLNALWADLFGRFVPFEPFVPRFKKQTQKKRSVDINLETVLPDGEVSGTPSSMLSYGNTNTAALSLFMALHLSVPTTLPWLIFDDPVQSMDDIHIANFATVVRQLSASHGRQVVIAVHQRELFEYLALELAPATADESLLKVSLDRHRGETVIQTTRVRKQREPGLTQSR